MRQHLNPRGRDCGQPISCYPYPAARALNCYLAGLPPAQGACQQRITLVVVFWAAKMEPQQGHPGSGPMRVLPNASTLRKAPGQTWLDDFMQGEADEPGADR